MKRALLTLIAVHSVIATQTLERDSWKIVPLTVPEGHVERIMFHGDDYGWITAFFAGLLKTENGGRTWSTLVSNLSTDRITAIWFASPSRGWAVGTSVAGAASQPVILSTKDGGRSWVVQRRLEDKAYLEDIWFLDEHNGWAVGSVHNRAVILSTENGGGRWETQYVGREATTELRRIRFADLRTGWAVGPNVIMHTKNGGRTWSPQLTGAMPLLNGLAVVDVDRVWVAAGQGTLLYTEDGGITWSRSELPADAAESLLWSVAFADASQGWVCGSRGTVLSTRDGGRSWTVERSYVDDMLFDVAATRHRLFAIGGSGRILVRERLKHEPD